MINEFEIFNSFAIKRMKENPGILQNQYNNLLFTKGLLLNSITKIKSRIINSGDAELIQLFEDWKSRKEMLARYFILSKSELKKKGINLDSLQNIANNMEKELSLKSEDFKEQFKEYKYSDVQNALKENEAAVEIVRFDYYDKEWTDTVYYAALILTGNSSDDFKSSDESDIKLILLKNGKDLENMYFNYYKKCVLSQKPRGDKFIDKDSYLQFWGANCR